VWNHRTIGLRITEPSDLARPWGAGSAGRETHSPVASDHDLRPLPVLRR
jgi:hypothetical protein